MIFYGGGVKRATAITTGISILVVGGLVTLAAPALAGAYTQVSAWQLFDPSPSADSEAAPAPTASEVSSTALPDDDVDVGDGVSIDRNDPEGCDEPAWLHLGHASARLSRDLIDRGPRGYANGTVGRDAQGRVTTYTVAAGDALDAIGDRFCLANPASVATLNHTRVIQPDELLLLRPDSTLPWIPYFNPNSATEGYLQIPYQRAVEAMSAAAHAGDLDALRSIFANDLEALFPDPAEADVIRDALAAGDLAALRQMFA